MFDWIKRLFRRKPKPAHATLAQYNRQPDMGVLAPILADLCNYWDVKIASSDTTSRSLVFFRFESRHSYGPPCAHVLIDALYDASRREYQLYYKQDLTRQIFESGQQFGASACSFSIPGRGWLEVRHTGLNPGLRNMPEVLMILRCPSDQLVWWRDALCPDLYPALKPKETAPCHA